MMRTVLSSVASSQEFGRQMAREAKQRRFHKAPRASVSGRWATVELVDLEGALPRLHADPGLHAALSYLFVVAKAIYPPSEDAWSQYLAWMRGCWRGEVDHVLEELRVWQSRLGLAPPKCRSTIRVAW